MGGRVLPTTLSASTNSSPAAHHSYGCLYGVELNGGNNAVAVVPGEVATAATIHKLVSTREIPHYCRSGKTEAIMVEGASPLTRRVFRRLPSTVTILGTIAAVLVLVVAAYAFGRRHGCPIHGASYEAPSASSSSTDYHIQILIGDGNRLMREGDILGARRFYEQAVVVGGPEGSPEAALALGRSYDPTYFEKLNVKNGEPAPAIAVEWYQKAVDGGISTAGIKIDALANWLKRKGIKVPNVSSDPPAVVTHD